ncbi:hypothetical protein VB711_21945 [Cronbergia sp. UHCC 0137]|uniref:hypothetical protein n=1 Tax=Cronbergia sp. UHCC 0137 TaxID=3110239 RepID=UPI002B21BFF7|nr:hypothetical protein [Cronbergia sp. UHCC 0137]MEA5620484.1 hypothetical protein [Cronbergia sp. UHCC 0137]
MKQSPIVKIVMIFLLSFGSLGIVIGSFSINKSSSNTATTEIITDTSQYTKIRNQRWTDLGQIKHFPLAIPADAKDINMAYSDSLIQGNSFFQIRFKQSPEQIKKLFSEYSKKSLRQYRGGNTNDHSNQPKGVPTTFFYTSSIKTESFPNTYQILVLKAQDQGQAGFKWNHGHSYGVAIDLAASEIVYWAEKW